MKAALASGEHPEELQWNTMPGEMTADLLRLSSEKRGEARAINPQTVDSGALS
jgi:hypothetical protein